MRKVNCSGPGTRSSATVDKFTASCECNNHDAFQNYSVSKRLFKTSSYDYSKCKLKWLIDNGHLIGDCVYVTAVFPMLENKWEVLITIQMIMTKK